MRRQDRYERLLDEANAQYARYEPEAARIVSNAKTTANGQGATHALQRAEVLGIQPDVFSAHVNWDALETLTGTLSPDSPLRGVIASHGANSLDVIESQLIAGMGRGAGADEIVREITRRLQGPVQRSRIRALVRTGSMRSYRSGMHTQMERMGDAIDGWVWTCARQQRTCLACLARDGAWYPMSQPFDMAHVNCRCSAVMSPSDLYPAARRVLDRLGTGEDWFARQPAHVQRRMIGSQQGYDAYRRGEIQLSDFVGTVHSDEWDTSIYQKSGSRVLRELGNREPGTASIEQLTTSARRMTGDEALRIGQVSPGSLASWSHYPNATNDMVITAERLAHAQDEHPELAGRERDIIETLLDPDEIHSSQSRTNAAMFFRTINERQDIAAPVWISNEPDKQNSMQTAFIANKRFRRRGRKCGNVVWEKEEE